jgi:hypothetical protein
MGPFPLQLLRGEGGHAEKADSRFFVDKATAGFLDRAGSDLLRGAGVLKLLFRL